VLPINAYTLTTAEQQQIGRAQTVVLYSCMGRAGYGAHFDLSAARQAADLNARNAVIDDGAYGNRRRYGVIDLTTVAKYGYHRAASVNRVTSSAPGGGSGLSKGDMSAAELAALGRCGTEADTASYGATKVDRVDVAEEISKASLDKSLNDPTVKAAFAEWSQCMKAKGYDWANPRVAGSAFDGNNSVVSPQEIAAAQTDVACKQQTHVVDVWQAFEVRYQNTQIEQQFQELQQTKDEPRKSDEAGRHGPRQRVTRESSETGRGGRLPRICGCSYGQVAAYGVPDVSGLAHCGRCGIGRGGEAIPQLGKGEGGGQPRRVRPADPGPVVAG
jgi:hypothetical protein